MSASLPEVWLRGPVEGVSPLLQPVVHSLLQVREELERTLDRLSPEEISARPGGAASVGYHARHMLGSLDRLLTYAEGRQLSREQLAALRAEAEEDGASADALRERVRGGIADAIARVNAVSPDALLDPREVGRGRLPSTVVGLLVHAAEHSTRHVGQAVTTAKIVRALAARAPADGDGRPA